MKRWGIARKLLVSILLCTFLIIAAIEAYSYLFSSAIIQRQSEVHARDLGEKTAAQIDGTLSLVCKVTDNIAVTLEDSPLSRVHLVRLGRRIIDNNSEIYGMAIAFAPYAFDSDEEYFSLYQYRSGGYTRQIWRGGEAYRYFHMDWYLLPKELGHAVWTEPYVDVEADNTLMVTYSVPFYRMKEGKRTFAGVITADVSLDWLQTMVQDIRIFETGYAFLLSRHGTFITHPDRDKIMNQTIFSLAEEMAHPELRQLGHTLLAGGTGFVGQRMTEADAQSHIFHTTLGNAGWTLGVVFSEQEMYADVRSLVRGMGLIGFGGFVILAAIIAFIALRITRPIRRLSVVAHDVAAGDLDHEFVVEASGDEVGELAEAFQTMTRSLKTHIQDLTTTTAAKERIESELRIARDIQMGILPKLFPAFPDRNEFEVFASIQPAKEVGGDLYDFFFVDDRHFCALIGDVSDKGVPAAFFMAVTKTLLKVVSERQMEPGEILAKVNNDLAAENESCMFVTLFLAILDIETGELRYANAGHNPPLFIPAGGEPEWVPSCHEPVLGVMEDMDYSTRTLHMQPGDTLFTYTDGVTEAMTADKALYSEDRLLQRITELPGATAQHMVETIDRSVAEFVDEADQSDDITMLALKFWGATAKPPQVAKE